MARSTRKLSPQSALRVLAETRNIVIQGYTEKEQCSTIYSQSPQLGYGSLERLEELTDSCHDQKQASFLFPLTSEVDRIREGDIL